MSTRASVPLRVNIEWSLRAFRFCVCCTVYGDMAKALLVASLYSFSCVDVNDFISQSGWFSHHGLPHGKVALKHVIARKAGISYDEFVNMEQAVYLLDYRHGEKVHTVSYLLHELT